MEANVDPKRGSNFRNGRCTNKGHFLQLPVAPRINARLRFSGAALTPGQCLAPDEALRKVAQLVEQGEVFDWIGLAGLGDPLALIEPTFKTLELLHGHLPLIPLFIKTLGLDGEAYAGRLAGLGVAHIDLEVNAITEDIVEKLYAWIRPGTKTLPLPDSAKILVVEQKKAVKAFKKAGMTISVVTTVFPENNSDQIESIAHQLADLGADDMILIPYQPEQEAEIKLSLPGKKLMETLHRQAAKYLPVSEEQKPATDLGIHWLPETSLPKPSLERPNVAVASSNGMDIDLHLGEAIQVLIYGPREDGLACLLGSRPTPEPGGGKTRWEQLATRLSDCFAILVASAGESPRKILAGRGINVLTGEGTIDATVDVLFGGGRKKKKGR